MTYLSRDGKSFGPFTEDELRKMRESGELLSYQWIWPQGAGNWQAIAPPPPPPPPPRADEAALASPPVPRKEKWIEKKIEAVCHDQQNVISGTLEHMTADGCDLVATSEDQDLGPVFSKKALVLLSLVESSTGRSMVIQARLVQAKREDGRWCYRLRWDECPALLSA